MSGKPGTQGRRTVSIAELRGTYPELDERERLSFVARHFCNGTTPSQIKELLQEEFGGEIRREEPYRLLQVAAAEGYFHYYPPLEVQLGESLARVDGVQHAFVVGTGEIEDVAERAADVLLDLIRGEWARKRATQEKTGIPDAAAANTVHIGLAGGFTVRRIVQALVELLKRENPATVPPTLYFHTVCTGIHYHDSSTDPNAFVTHLLGVPGIETETFAVPYQAPPVTRPALRKMLEEEPHMRNAEREFPRVDIIVTSGSSWRISEVTLGGEIVPARTVAGGGNGTNGDPLDGTFSQLKALMQQQDPIGYRELLDAGVVADTLWQPLSFNGPIRSDTNVKAMTLARLDAIPDFIASDKKVLLALGPYNRGIFHKGDVLLAALGGPMRVGGPLFTHLVCDHRTAGAAVRVLGLDTAGGVGESSDTKARDDRARSDGSGDTRDSLDPVKSSTP